MKDSRILRGLDILRPLFERLQLDYPILRAILQAKMTMDGRQVPTITLVANQGMKKRDLKGAKDKNAFLRSLWIYGVMSLTVIPFIVWIDNYVFEMSIVFGILMFLVMTSLISDFSTVLLDIRDRGILATKPIDRRTLSMAKFIHILIYMFYVTGALTALPLLVGLIKQGILFFSIFLIDVILMDLLIIVLTAVIYFIVLKFFDGERLKDIINYVQIGLSIAITLGYQLISHLFRITDIGVAFHTAWWQFFFIPVWFAAPFELFLHGGSHSYIYVFSVLALVIPIVLLFIYIRIMPIYERNLQKLTEQGERGRRKEGRIARGISELVCRDREERIFYRFATAMMSTERDFKLKVYPLLGFSIVFPLIFFFVLNGSTGLRASKNYLFIYFCAILVPTVLQALRYSTSYKASWIYTVAPIKNIKAIYKGNLKAFLMKLLLPIFTLESILFLFIFGRHILPHLIVVFLILPLYVVGAYLIYPKVFPFSLGFETTQSEDTMPKIPLLLILGSLAILHLWVTTLSWGVYAYIGILLVMNAFIWRVVFPSPWKR